MIHKVKPPHGGPMSPRRNNNMQVGKKVGQKNVFQASTPQKSKLCLSDAILQIETNISTSTILPNSMGPSKFVHLGAIQTNVLSPSDKANVSEGMQVIQEFCNKLVERLTVERKQCELIYGELCNTNNQLDSCELELQTNSGQATNDILLNIRKKIQALKRNRCHFELSSWERVLDSVMQEVNLATKSVHRLWNESKQNETSFNENAKFNSSMNNQAGSSGTNVVENSNVNVNHMARTIQSLQLQLEHSEKLHLAAEASNQQLRSQLSQAKSGEVASLSALNDAQKQVKDLTTSLTELKAQLKSELESNFRARPPSSSARVVSKASPRSKTPRQPTAGVTVPGSLTAISDARGLMSSPPATPRSAARNIKAPVSSRSISVGTGLKKLQALAMSTSPRKASPTTTATAAAISARSPSPTRPHGLSMAASSLSDAWRWLMPATSTATSQSPRDSKSTSKSKNITTVAPATEITAHHNEWPGLGQGLGLGGGRSAMSDVVQELLKKKRGELKLLKAKFGDIKDDVQRAEQHKIATKTALKEWVADFVSSNGRQPTAQEKLQLAAHHVEAYTQAQDAMRSSHTALEEFKKEYVAVQSCVDEMKRRMTDNPSPGTVSQTQLSNN